MENSDLRNLSDTPDIFLCTVQLSKLDELYIINTKSLQIDGVDHMDKVEVGATKAVIRRALKKNTSGKLQNRVLLNAFIKKVA